MTVEPKGTGHRPVLYQEVIHALQPASGGRYADCTLGAGGHAWGILQASTPNGELLGLEVDPQAFELAGERLGEFGERAHLVRVSYETLGEQLKKLGWQNVDGVLFDLGVSSMQLDTPNRGFSFLYEAPLDMRFDPRTPVSAADLVNNLPEAELAQVLFRFGEEPRGQRIARELVKARPIQTTVELAEIVAKVVGQVKGNAGRGQRSRRSSPSSNTHLSSFEDCSEPGIGSLGEYPPTSCSSIISWRQAGGDRIPFIGGPDRKTILSPREPRLHLSASPTGVHLRSPGELDRDHSPSAPASPGGASSKSAGT